MTFLDHAVYLRIRPGDKIPAEQRGWQEPDWPGRDEEELIGYNVGLLTGDRSGVVALDIDGALGEAKLKQWCEEADEELPPGPWQTTPGGGRHIFFSHESCPHLRNIVHKLSGKHEGIDLKTTGGYVVVYPSCTAAGKYTLYCEDTPVPDMPEWLVTKLTNLRQRAASATANYCVPMKEALDILGAMPVRGSGGDGSSALVRMARRACFLGIRKTEDFIQASKIWAANAGVWSEDDLAKRFEDALERYEAEGRIDLPITKQGHFVCNEVNMQRVLTEDQFVSPRLGFNELTREVEIDRHPANDATAVNFKLDILNRYEWGSYNAETFHRLLVGAAKQNSYHPVEEYLRGLKWDGTPRLEQAACKILNAEGDIPAKYFRMWFISAVARALKPGEKVDNTLVLVGPQGIRKSSLFSMLATTGKGNHFADTYIDIRNKDALMVLNGLWIYEMSELNNVIGHKQVETVKAFLSSRKDRYRASYARFVETVPRSCVIVGTTNEDEFLRDPTGNRRFWPIFCTLINFDWARAFKDQLWAEAVYLYDQGEKWYFESETEEMLAYKSQFEPERPLYERALEIINLRIKKAEGTKVIIKTQELMAIMGVNPERTKPAIEIRDALKAAGFKQRSVRMNGKVTKAWVLDKAETQV